MKKASTISELGSLTLRRALAYAVYKLGGTLNITDYEFETFCTNYETRVYEDEVGDVILESKRYGSK